jgi:biopolymer transport protein ExbB
LNWLEKLSNKKLTRKTKVFESGAVCIESTYSQQLFGSVNYSSQKHPRCACKTGSVRYFCILQKKIKNSNFNYSFNMKKQESSSFSAAFATIVIPLSVVVGTLIYMFVLGNPDNFIDGKVENNPIKDGIGKWLGTFHKGGFVVPILLSLLIMVITFCIERFITISKAKGVGSVPNFVRAVKGQLDAGNIDAAIAQCDKQKGSVANVMRAGLEKYTEMSNENTMAKDQKVLAIQKEVEEATTLELPMLEKNLVILSTISSIATLMGLFGTVLGMIRSFAALAESGAGGTNELSIGISEALINTALGIGTSALAIIMYNFFTTQIDKLTYGIDESGYSITQTFASKHK